MSMNRFAGYDETHIRMIEVLEAAEKRVVEEARRRKEELEYCECREGMFPNPTRRQVLIGAAALTAGVMGFGSKTAVAEAPPGSRKWPVPDDPTKVQGRLTFEDGGYGSRSQFETEVRWLLPMPPMRESSATHTPLSEGHGIITPSGLHFERHHAGIPNIDPARHRLYVHGMVNNAMVFSVDELKRLPSVSKIMFTECSGNTFTEWEKPRLKTVQGTHGLTSTSEWVGVPVSTLMAKCGIQDGAAWVMAEGADAAVMNRSIPLDKMMNDAIIAYAQNGEAIRPEQGYPLRLFLPGYEGNMHIKWLRRLVVSDKPFMTREETSKYTDLRGDGKAVMFSFVMEAKSVITFPSGEMYLPGPGFYEVTGLAWSGRGKIRRVEISTDGGKNWSLAALQDPVLPMCHTRFRFPWYWNGEPAVLQSRATDDTGYVQPTIKDLVDVRGLSRPGIGQFYHMNGIQSWAVAADGSVSNVHVY